MGSNGSSTSGQDFLSAQQLRIGIFVMLDVPWFKHDFTLNNFKIRTEDQLRDLRALGLAQYRFNPQRSDPEAVTLALTSPAPAPAGPQSLLDPISPDNAELSDRGQQAEPATPEQQRRLRNQLRRENIERVEKAFAKAAAVMKNLNRNIYVCPKETLEEMGALVDDMVRAFLSSPDATLHVMGEKCGGEDVYFHSLNVTILAMMLAREMGFTQAQACDMGLGAMLHDVGLAEIPDWISRKPASESTLIERNMRATHVALGVALAERIGLSTQALAVVAQHHEFADGSGYPKGLTEAAMAPEARLVSLVNFYDNLCNPPDMDRAMTPHQALSYMFAQCRDKFEARALQLLIRSLGVHPPGSIVQLSDQSLAVVTAVNPKKPLRPWVLVYDEQVPKDEAITLNLALDLSVSIVKSIRPALLSPKVAAYLNPRKRVTYFFDADSSDADAAGA